MQSAASALGVVDKREFVMPSYRTLRGESISPLRIGYEVYGRLSPARDNAVLVCHHFSGSSHAAGLYAEDDAQPGWWDSIIGPGKAIDTGRWCVICSDTPLCLPARAATTITTGPASLDPTSGRPYGPRFPLLSAADFVEVQNALLESLGVARLAAVAGPSGGAIQAALWAVRYPDKVARAMLAVGPGLAMSAYPLAMVRQWGEPIRLDPAWRGGDYYDGPIPEQGLTAALERVLLSTLHFDGLAEQFDRRWEGDDPAASLDGRYAVESWLTAEARARAADIDPNHLLYMVKAVQQYDIRERLDRYRASTLLLPARSDLLFPPVMSHEMAETLRRRGLEAAVVEIPGDGGHLDGLAGISRVEAAIRRFLED